MESYLDILKYTIPSLVVFCTAYFMLKLYLDKQRDAELLSHRSDGMKITLPLRLQAYERLMLLCDRAALPNALLRVRTPDMKTSDLRIALLLSVNQEFDHNAVQQLYVSETLWKIILLAKDETLNLIAKAAEGIDPNADADEMVTALFKEMDAQGPYTPLQKAAAAIRTEASRLF